MLKKHIPLLLWITLLLIAIPLTSYASSDVELLDALASDQVVDGDDDDGDSDDGDSDDDDGDGDDDDGDSDDDDGDSDDDDGDSDDDDGDSDDDDGDGDDDDGDGDDDDGDNDDDDDDNEAKVYATIDSFPASPYVGTWQIGGVTYEATANTEFEQEHGPFAVGACVEAEYNTLTAANTLHEVETEQAYKCANGTSQQFSTYGTVATLPTNPDWTGTWQVAGVSVEANNQTAFDQTHGLFNVGTYLEVKYTVNSNTLVANSIRTHVSPGNGTGTQFAQLTAFDDTDEWNEWVIGGVSYRGDPAMDIASGDRAPRLGDTVAFNSYEQDGMRYLTEVSAAMQLFLPAIQR